MQNSNLNFCFQILFLTNIDSQFIQFIHNIHIELIKCVKHVNEGDALMRQVYSSHQVSTPGSSILQVGKLVQVF